MSRTWDSWDAERGRGLTVGIVRPPSRGCDGDGPRCGGCGDGEEGDTPVGTDGVAIAAMKGGRGKIRCSGDGCRRQARSWSGCSSAAASAASAAAAEAMVVERAGSKARRSHSSRWCNLFLNEIERCRLRRRCWTSCCWWCLTDFWRRARFPVTPCTFVPPTVFFRFPP